MVIRQMGAPHGCAPFAALSQASCTLPLDGFTNGLPQGGKQLFAIELKDHLPSPVVILQRLSALSTKSELSLALPMLRSEPGWQQACYNGPTWRGDFCDADCAHTRTGATQLS
jgi:hypothetical protein